MITFMSGIIARRTDLTDLERELLDRLLWLRNHYDVGKKEHKAEVLGVVDLTLNKVINR